MNEQSAIGPMMAQIGAAAREASTVLAGASSSAKELALQAAADAIWDQRAAIIEANKKDLAFGAEKGLSPAMMDRLMLDEVRIAAMADGLRAVAGQADPIGEVTQEWTQPTGLNIKRVRTPIGVIGVIYESRPNVTADAGALCLKSGNAVVLRGGSESFHSSQAIHACLVAGLQSAGLPEASVQLVPTRDRAAVTAMLQATDHIDVIVPRGGKGLVGLVQREARVPVFAHLEGICHVYVDADADLEKAKAVLVNAKTRRTGICGSAETVLVDQAFHDKYGDILTRALLEAGVEVRADTTLAQTEGTIAAKPEDFGQEFLDMIIAAKIVDGVDGAIAHIRQYGSNHTDAIITEDDAVAKQFFVQLDSAILMRNASTQFADGGCS